MSSSKIDNDSNHYTGNFIDKNALDGVQAQNVSELSGLSADSNIGRIKNIVQRETLVAWVQKAWNAFANTVLDVVYLFFGSCLPARARPNLDENAYFEVDLTHNNDQGQNSVHSNPEDNSQFLDPDNNENASSQFFSFKNKDLENVPQGIEVNKQAVINLENEQVQNQELAADFLDGLFVEIKEKLERERLVASPIKEEEVKPNKREESVLKTEEKDSNNKGKAQYLRHISSRVENNMLRNRNPFLKGKKK